MSRPRKQQVRLDRLLANLGYGSRREVQGLLASGAVALDGESARRGEEKLPLEPALRARLRVGGEELDPLPGLTLMMNKPVGLTCSHSEQQGPLVYELLPQRWQRREPPISTVGRLDKETSGLLLLTDDGSLLHRIQAPKSAVPKRYRALLARPLAGNEGEAFASGDLMLQGEEKPLLPARLEILSPTEAVLEIVEGRYHQVRRMFAAVGNHVEQLRRESVGGLSLGGLPEGQFRVLDAEDMAAIFGSPEIKSI